MVNKELKELLQDVEVEEASLQRIEQKVFAHIQQKKPKKRKTATYIGVAIAATLCAAIVTYQIPAVKAWVKENVSYIPGFNEKVDKPGGILYEVKKKYTEGKFTVYTAAYEATLPYFNIEFGYETGIEVNGDEEWRIKGRPLIDNLEKRDVKLVVGNESFPLTFKWGSFESTGLISGTYSLDEAVKQLPILEKPEVTLQFGEEQITIPLTENEDHYIPVKSQMVNGYELQGMMLEKNGETYINFIDEKKEWSPFIFDGFKAWMENSSGKKYNLKPNESGSGVYDKYKVKGSKAKKIVIPYLRQDISYKDEKITIPIPPKIGGEMMLPAYEIKNSNVTLVGAKVIRTAEDKIEIELPERVKTKEDWLLEFQFGYDKEHLVVASARHSSDRKSGMFTPTHYEIPILPTDKGSLQLNIDAAYVVHYGPWELEIKK